jgi:hypothetical protein
MPVKTFLASSSDQYVSILLGGPAELTALQDGTRTTLMFGCASGSDSNNCGFGDSNITVTYGPSTFIATETISSDTVAFDCTLTGTTAGVCKQTYIGPAGDLDFSATAGSVPTSYNTAITTEVTTTTLAPTDFAFVPVTITSVGKAGATATTTTASQTGTTPASGSASASMDATMTAKNATHTGGASLKNAVLPWILPVAGLFPLVAWL